MYQTCVRNQLAIHRLHSLTIKLDLVFALCQQKHATIITVTVKKFKEKVKGVYSYLWVQYPITELQRVTCHTESHSVTWHSTQVNVPCLNPSQAG